MQKLALALFLMTVGILLAGCASCRKPIEYPHTYVVDHECTLIQPAPGRIINTGNCGR